MALRAVLDQGEPAPFTEAHQRIEISWLSTGVSLGEPWARPRGRPGRQEPAAGASLGEGASADLVILGEDPRANLASLSAPLAIVLRGRVVA